MTELVDAPAQPAGLNYVGGAWVPSASGETYAKLNPMRPAETTGEYTASNEADAEAAVAAAAGAFAGWAALPMARRAALSERPPPAVLEQRTEQIARDMTHEMGKPLREARGEAARAAQILRFAASEAFRSVGEHFEQAATGAQVSTRRRPVGVVALITPWNFPCAIPVWKLAPALIYGNTVVLKLAYEAPRTGLHIAEAFAEAELPAGVLNVLTGRGSVVGAALVRDPRVRAISFTGSVATGHGVRDEATRLGKRVQLELGGHNPLIVMADADLDRAVEATYAGAFWSAGQKCTATRRISSRTRSTTRSASGSLARIESGKVGDPLDPAVEVGPIVNESQFDEIVAAIERGQAARAARVVAGGGAGRRRGYVIAPTVFEDVADDAFLSCEEVFGPVASLYRFATLDEATRPRERRRLRALGGDLHLEPRRGDALPERGAGGAAARQLADRRRRRARAVRRHQVERLRPARAGPRRDRVLHRDGHGLRRRVSERFLVTGALGCIGAWSCALLAAGGRLRRRLRPRRRSTAGFVSRRDAKVPLEQGDITDREALARSSTEHEITHVIHLAALLLPMIKRDPPHGTAVNIGGTVNVLDAAKTRGIQVAFASSVAVYSPVDDDGGAGAERPASGIRRPTTACTSRRARRWRGSSGRRSTCRRSGSARASSTAPAATTGSRRHRPWRWPRPLPARATRIAFGGRTQMQYAPDTARVFVAAARAATEGSRVFHLGGPVVSQAEVAAAIERAAPGVSVEVDEETLLPFPEDFDGSALEQAIGPIAWTPLDEGVAPTIERLRATA